jgi:hypothetical protein
MAVHKWFARRPGTLFRSLLLSEFNTGQLRDEFHQSQALTGLSILDPFMGGGTTLIEANRVGCAITGFDINPMAWWIVRQEITDLDLEKYGVAAKALRAALEGEVGDLYRTRGEDCGSNDAHVKYFLWVKSPPASIAANPWTSIPTTSSPKMCAIQKMYLSVAIVGSNMIAKTGKRHRRVRIAKRSSRPSSPPDGIVANASTAGRSTNIRIRRTGLPSIVCSPSSTTASVAATSIKAAISSGPIMRILRSTKPPPPGSRP